MTEPEEKTETIITRKLPFALTDHDRAMRGKLLADMLKDIDGDTLAMKAENARRKMAIAEKVAAAMLVRESCITGKELREVDCYREPDLGGKVWRIRRCDTKEDVGSNPMSKDDIDEFRQMDLIDELADKKFDAENTEAKADGDEDSTDTTPEVH